MMGYRFIRQDEDDKGEGLLLKPDSLGLSG